MYACDPCEDCGSPLIFDPTFDLMFINADSLKDLTDSTAITETNSELLSILQTNLSDTLNSLGDSLDVIQDSIANGGNLEVELMAIEMAIEDFTNDQEVAAENQEVQDSLTSVMADVIALLNTGKGYVRKIEFVETGDTLCYLDSAINYTVPISFDKAFTQYEISIADSVYAFELDYTIFEEVDIERNVTLRVKDLQIILLENSFDSLQTCEICTDGEASFILYY